MSYGYRNFYEQDNIYEYACLWSSDCPDCGSNCQDCIGYVSTTDMPEPEYRQEVIDDIDYYYKNII